MIALHIGHSFRFSEMTCILLIFLLNAITIAHCALNFYKPPKTAKLAENYTITLEFYIDAPNAETFEPVCGFVRNTASETCQNTDQNAPFAINAIFKSGYSLKLSKPISRKSVELFGKPTYEVFLSLLPPEVQQPAPTQPPVIFPPGVPTTTVPQVITPAPSIFKLPSKLITTDVFCCVKGIEAGSYINQLTIFIESVTLAPANWSGDSKQASFRRFADPSQNPRSLCSCDFHVGFCDSLCCCDQSCSKKEKTSFGCDEEEADEFIAPPPEPPYDCDLLLSRQGIKYPATAVFNPFPHAWLCIMYKNSALLGNYYTDLTYDAINDQTYLENKKKAAAGVSFYSLTEFISNGYRQGVPLLSVPLVDSRTSVNMTIQKMPLRAAKFFPGRGPDGRCLTNMPIRFLRNQEPVYCASQPVVLPSQCSDPSFSQARYIPQGDTIISKVERDGIFQTLPNIRCSCNIMRENGSSSLPLCQFKNETLCTRPRPVPVSTTPCSCSDNDAFRPTLITNENLWYCTNFVKSVELRLGWSGNAINASTSSVAVELADRVSSGQRLEQKFSVTFSKPDLPLGLGRNPVVQMPNKPPWKYFRRGEEVKVLPLGETSPTCGCLNPIALRFGQGSYSACPFELTEESLLNCDNLRGMTISALRKLIPAERIARIALPAIIIDNLQQTQFQPDEWITVQKLRRFPAAYPICNPNVQQTIATEGVPPKVGRFPRLYRQLDERSRQAFSSLDGVTGQINSTTFCNKQISRLLNLPREGNTTARTAEIVWTAACSTKRICERVPSAIHLTVFQSISGAVNGTMQHEIVGATLSFSVRDVLFDSIGSRKQLNLKATVKFITLPQTPEKPTFYSRLTSMTTAWDILYPLHAESENFRSVAAAAGIGLLLVAGLVIAPPK